jgi:pimeloyl-ACP methyl ester carboxylesterase
MHDRIARDAYSAATELTRTLVRAGAEAASAARAPDARSIERTAAGRAMVSARNGAFGDTMVRRANPLALGMSVRRRGRDLELTRAAIGRAYPNAKPRLAVFVHGLCETDDAWKHAAAWHVPYGHRMDFELGYTPVYLRYNTGRHVSENGRDLAQLLERLVAEWPVAVHELVLIGHSMGGLVARSACHYGAGSACVAKVHHVFTLGTPHRGAPLEQAASAASAALARLPETRPLARALNVRSSGIKDLRYGYLVDECWLDQDCDTFLRNTSRAIPFLPTARHYFICATLSREPDAAVGRTIGTCWCWRRARGRTRGAASVSNSQSSTTTTSAGRTTSTCSTTRRSTPRCAAVWAASGRYRPADRPPSRSTRASRGPLRARPRHEPASRRWWPTARRVAAPARCTARRRT